MKRGENLESIPTDLILEIFSRLPAKSTVRFRCVSKLWRYMLRGPYFTELFLTRSSARPRTLLMVKRNSDWLFFSSPQPQKPYENSSIVVAADFHIKFISKDKSRFSYASGLLCFSDNWNSKELVPVICNPMTGQNTILPTLGWHRNWYSFLGFDPIGKQYKVLLAYHPYAYGHKILTLGTGKLRWRTTSCPVTYKDCCREICINGVLYYLALLSDESSYVIVCFDVRSEKFKFIDPNYLFCDPQYYSHLINYKGKLGRISWKYTGNGLELSMLILEDVEKHEWSLYAYTLPKNRIVDLCPVYVVGVTATGEIVLPMSYTCNSFYVLYYNPERNTLQSVEIQGFGANREAIHYRVYTFVDYVEDIGVNDGKQLNSSIFAPSVKKNRRLNIIRTRPKPHHRKEIRERDIDKRYDYGVSREKIHKERSNERDSREDKTEEEKEDATMR